MHRRLGSRVRQADLVDLAHSGYTFGDFDLQWRRPCKDIPSLEGFLNFRNDGWICMTEDDRTETEPIINVASSVCIPDIRALAAGHHQRVVVPPVAEVGINTVRDHRSGTLV